MQLGIPGLGDAVELGRTAAVTTYRSITTDGRSVVVKVLSREATPDVWARFDYDHQRLAELAGHPNVVPILGHGRTPENRAYVVLDDVPGGSFAARVGAGMDGLGVVSVGVRVAGALESAHRRDVVHGDLRPEDILIDEGGEPEVADFGLVMSTGVGPERATDPRRLAHAAPEQLAGALPTPATDVYALGSILYALLAGAPAFLRPGEASVANVGLRIRSERPAPLQELGIPQAVAAVVERALEKDPAARWSSAEALGIALQQCEIALLRPLTPMVVTGQDRVIPRLPPEDPQAEVIVPVMAGSKAGVIAGAVAAVVIVVIVGFLLFGGDDVEDPNGGREPITAPGGEAFEFEFRDVSDDGGVITLQAPDIWGQEDGTALAIDDAQTFTANDLSIADGDPVAFTQAGGLDIAGLEATVFSRDDLEANGLQSDADGVRSDRVGLRQLANDCTTSRPPEARTIAGFEGATQRFEDCGEDAATIVVFAGIDGDDALVLEAHILRNEDEAAAEAVFDSVEVDR